MNSKQRNQRYYKTYWNERMINYLYRSAGSRWFDHLFEIILAKIPKSSVKSVADIGCGVGNKTATMAKYFPKAKVVGYDFSKAGIEAAINYHKIKSGIKNLNFETSDVTSSKSNKRFDLITAFDFLEHIEDWQDITKKLININNRYMIISSPVGRMRPYEVHIGHVRNFKKDEIETFMEAQGYKTVKRFYAGFPFHSPILRNVTNMFYKNYAALPESEMSFISRRMHDIWYFLFRYCSMKNKGDIFVGLFEKKKTNR